MSLAFLHALDAQEAHTDAIWGTSWLRDDTAVSISADGAIKQWDSTSGQASRVLAPHPLGLVSLSVVKDSVLFNSLEGTTSLWELSTGNVIKHESFVRAGKEQVEPAWSVSLNPRGGSYAATGGSGSISIHSAESSNFGERIALLDTSRNKYGMHCKYSPDGARVALANETGQIYVFETATNTLVNTYTSHAMSIRSLAWSPDSSLLLSASEDKRLVLHDVRSGAVASFAGHSSWVLSTDISPDGRLALSGSADKTIKVWDIAARAAVSTIQDTGEVWSVSWRPKISATSGSAGAFVSGGEDGVVRWWRAAGAN